MVENYFNLRRERELQYLLSGYISSRRQTRCIDGVYYDYIFYQGDHRNEYLVYPSSHTGIVKLYKYGVLSMTWEVSKGKRIGNVSVYDKGCIMLEESWDSIFGTGDSVSLINTICGKKLLIEDKDSHKVIYFGDCNYEMKKHGNGVVFDPESGEELFEGKWNRGVLLYITKSFDNGEMIEYKEGSYKDDITQCCPVYIGEYKFDEGQGCFVRHGKGCLIEEVTHAASRCSQWDMGTEVSGFDMSNGSYSYQTVVPRGSDFDSIPWCAQNLVIESKNFNRETQLDFSNFCELRSLTIGNRCFKNVDNFSIDGLPFLQWIKIESESFTQVRKDESWDKDDIINTDRCFSIKNCPLLYSIDIGPFSFMSFAGAFALYDLPVLSSIRIGDSGDSSNFYYSNLTLQDLPKLATVFLGKNAFRYPLSVIIKNLPSLQSITLLDSALRGKNSTVVLENLPSLVKFTTDKNNFNSVDTAVVNGIPNSLQNEVMSSLSQCKILSSEFV